MIITCNNCNKQFNLDSDLIPDKGRLLQCVGCKYKWFFKKTINSVEGDKNDVNALAEYKITSIAAINPSDLLREETEVSAKKDLEKKIEVNTEEELERKIVVNTEENIAVKTNPKKQKNFKILNIFIVAIISFIAFIIIVDTFKYPIGKIVPNTEFILYNLYETIKDVSLFIKDLS